MSKTNRLKVTDLDPDITESELKLRFENTRRGGGGPVKEVKLNRDKKSAIIVFEGFEAVDRVFRNGITIPINGKTYNLRRMVMPKKEDRNGRKTPERSMSSASSLASFKSDKSGSQSSSSATKSSERSKEDLPTSTKREKARNRQASASSDSSESHYKQDVASSKPESVQDLAGRTIKATVRDINRSKDSFYYYLGDPKVNEGEFDKESMLLDGLRRHLFVTFYDEKDARLFCRMSLGEQSNFVNVEIATANDVSYYKNIISVHSHNVGFGSGGSLNLLRHFVTERTGQRVVDITQYDEPRSVLLEFVPEKCAGKLGEIGWRISGEPFEGENLITAPVYRTNMVIVSGLRSTTTENTLLCFLSHPDSGGERGAVISPVMWQGSKAVVELQSGKCVRNILGKAPHWLDDKEISIQHFHPCLTAQMYNECMGRPLPQPTSRRTQAQIQSPPVNAEQMSVKAVSPTPDSDNENKTRSAMDVDSSYDNDDTDQNNVRNEQHVEMEVEDSDGNEDEKTGRKGESRKRSLKRHFDLEEYEFDMLKDMNILKQLERNYKVAIKGGEEEGFYAAGQNKEMVNEAVIEILKITKQFKTMSLKDLDMNKVELLQITKIQMKIKEKLSRKNVTVHFQQDENEFSITYHPAEGKSVVEEVITSQAEMKQLSLDDEETLSVLQSPKGKAFLHHLSVGHDNQPPAVVKLSHKEHSITLVSPKKCIPELQKQIQTFIEDNKICGKMISVPSGKQEFIERFETPVYKKVVDGLKETGTTVHCRPEENKIEVKGPTDGIEAAEAGLLPLYDGVATLTLPLEYFGIKELMKREDGKELLENIEGRYQCIIRENFPNSLSHEESAEGPATREAIGEAFGVASGDSVTTIAGMSVNGCSIVFKQGSLLDIKADVIVNAVDELLKCKTTISKAIIGKGGKKIEEELARSVFGRAGDVIPTSAGQLENYRGILHLVCPVFNASKSSDIDALMSGIALCLDKAHQHGFTSIAFPTLGVGRVFKFPDLAASTALLKSIKSHLERGSTSLKEIIVCDMQASNLKTLMERCESTFTGFQLERLQKPVEEKAMGEGAVPKSPTGRVPHTGKGFGHISVKVDSGEITRQKTDVIVNVTEKSLTLHKSKMGQAVLDHGGKSIQYELESKYKGGIQPGEFAETSNGNLKCRHIFHACVPFYDRGKENQLTRLVLKMLESADEKHAKSIAIPALGTGYSKYPADVSALTIMGAISQFAMEHPHSSLKSVKLVIFSGGKDDVLQPFKAALTLSQKGEGGASSYGAQSMETTMHFGPVKLTVKKGDIIEEKCDVIVNAIREDMDLSSSGAVGKSLYKKCGAWLQNDCKSKAFEMKQKGMVVTSGSILHCISIIHLSNEKFGHSWDRGLLQAFEMADKKHMKSLAFPVFGAGKKSADLQRIKDMIITAVERFGNSGSHTLKDLRVVIFSQELMDAFLEGSHQAEPRHGGRFSRQSSHGGRVSRQSSYSEHSTAAAATASTPRVSEKTEVTIYSRSLQICKAAAEALQGELEQKFMTGKEEESTVKQFSHNQINDLKEFGLKNNLFMSVDTKEGIITFKGFLQEKTMSALQKKLRDLVKDAVEERHNTIHKAIPLAIQWQYKDKRGKWRDFEPLLNSTIEIEYGKKSKWHEIADARGRIYRIDFKDMTEHELDEHKKPAGPSIEIQRNDRTKEEALPKKWDSMHSYGNLRLVPVTPGSSEYQKVAKQFQENGSTAPIKKIERIQNKALYQQYAVKKREIDARNPKRQRNERKLFHGTSAKGVSAICENGFNRNYSGKNATMYGEGVYFAVDSSYATAYAEADHYGQSKIFVARVLVGESVTTDSGTRYLPNKPDSQFPYDSGTDGNGKVFIIFHDAQAYPEYLITF